MRIVFIGTPEFAAKSLSALVDSGFEIVAVVTAPDKPAGRGMHLRQSEVKKFALENHIPIMQPLKLNDETFMNELRSYRADLQIVIAFRMLPEPVWKMPPLGTINLHASLLPDYRGAAPINHVLINGETETGVTTFFLKHEVDTGDIILTKKVSITPEMDAGELHDRLMNVGAEVVVETATLIKEHRFHLKPQRKHSVKKAPKIFTEFCQINWNDEGMKIHNLVRGLSPYPGALTSMNGKILKVYKTSFTELIDLNINPGTIETDQKSFLRIACKNGWIQIIELQLEGKKRMTVDEFLRGYKVQVNMII